MAVELDTGTIYHREAGDASGVHVSSLRAGRERKEPGSMFSLRFGFCTPGPVPPHVARPTPETETEPGELPAKSGCQDRDHCRPLVHPSREASTFQPLIWAYN
ncbi:hypothetical protein GWI33_014336 [Rhynchophorus ferrugineus]|uniref:Uncharacterized protein n=1 Tax=Rhynchophorus ferrugineus TaxID=354439 RepID=A0A834I4P9_RHYFE|nr:hypothetical protein GWI33_014336 [Rhynchophorus ferrugineus]